MRNGKEGHCEVSGMNESLRFCKCTKMTMNKQLLSLSTGQAIYPRANTNLFDESVSSDWLPAGLEALAELCSQSREHPSQSEPKT